MPAPKDPIKYAAYCQKLKDAIARRDPAVQMALNKKKSEKLKGIPRSEAVKRKIGDAQKGEKNHQYGKHLSEETKRKIGEQVRNRPQEWRDKLSIAHTNPSEETRKKLSAARLGKSRSEETKEKISIAHTGKKFSEERCKNIKISKQNISDETRAKMSVSGKAKVVSDEFREKRRQIMKEQWSDATFREKHSGENSVNWKDGSSFEPYCPKFNKPFREHVRDWFNFQCVNCGETQGNKKLAVHHVYYNKKACCEQNENGEYIYNIDGEQVKVIGNPNKFVALCKSCHPKTNHNRVYWARYLEDIINNWYGGRSWIDE